VSFVLICGSVYLAPHLNSLLAANWQLLGFSQNYFDSRGVFISAMYSAPLLFIAFLQMVSFESSQRSSAVSMIHRTAGACGVDTESHRYRLFPVCAAVRVFLLYQLADPSQAAAAAAEQGSSGCCSPFKPWGGADSRASLIGCGCSHPRVNSIFRRAQEGQMMLPVHCCAHDHRWDRRTHLQATPLMPYSIPTGSSSSDSSFACGGLSCALRLRRASHMRRSSTETAELAQQAATLSPSALNATS
jgi:hypothetical protein